MNRGPAIAFYTELCRLCNRSWLSCVLYSSFPLTSYTYCIGKSYWLCFLSISRIWQFLTIPHFTTTIIVQCIIIFCFNYQFRAKWSCSNSSQIMSICSYFLKASHITQINSPSFTMTFKVSWDLVPAPLFFFSLHFLVLFPSTQL